MRTPKNVLEGQFDRLLPFAYAPRFNIAPTQPVLTIIGGSGETRRWEQLKWGLIPSWAKDQSIASKLINARSETALEKPSFREAVRRRRCLVVADGFYEWKTAVGAKQPFLFTLPSGQAFAFAGLWERWRDCDTGVEIKTCTILTKAAGPEISEIHHRMPVIVDPSDYHVWLDPKTPLEQIENLMCLPGPALALTRVGSAVNSSMNDTPDCVQPFGAV